MTAALTGVAAQEHGPSVQQALEEALHEMTGKLATVHAAGRTDAGVHALAMSAHVDIEKALTPHRLREGLNALVRPQPISLLDVQPVADDWHARFSCCPALPVSILNRPPRPRPAGARVTAGGTPPRPPPRVEP